LEPVILSPKAKQNMSLSIFEALFSDAKKRELLASAQQAKPVAFAAGTVSVVVAGLGLVFIRNGGVCLGLFGYVALVAGSIFGAMSRDAYTVACNTEKLVESSATARARAALSSELLTCSLLKDCLVLPVFKGQIKAGLEKAKEEERKRS
jgi:hypothetical protein